MRISQQEPVVDAALELAKEVSRVVRDRGFNGNNDTACMQQVAAAFKRYAVACQGRKPEGGC